MNTKTPISILQELMVAEKKALPTYIDQHAALVFKCTVKAGDVVAIGRGTNKKAAKQDSAKKALEKLGYNVFLTDSHSVQCKSALPIVRGPITKTEKNSVGELNEYASKRGLGYPTYICHTVNDIQNFIYACRFLDKETFGRAANKKDAKQAAAVEMLQLVSSLDYKEVKMDCVGDAKIISLFSKLVLDRELNSDNGRNINNNCYQKLTKEVVLTTNTDEFKNSVESVSNLEKKLNAVGLEYLIKEVQRKPYVISVAIKNTAVTFLATDGDRNEAIRKGLLKVFNALKQGFFSNLSDHFYSR